MLFVCQVDSEQNKDFDISLSVLLQTFLRLSFVG